MSDKKDFLNIPEWVRDVPGLKTITEVVVLAKLMSLTNEGQKEASTSISYLCLWTKCTNKGTRKIIDRLKSLGYIKSINRGSHANVFMVTEKVMHYKEELSTYYKRNSVPIKEELSTAHKRNSVPRQEELSTYIDKIYSKDSIDKTIDSKEKKESHEKVVPTFSQKGGCASDDLISQARNDVEWWNRVEEWFKTNSAHTTPDVAWSNFVNECTIGHKRFRDKDQVQTRFINGVKQSDTFKHSFEYIKQKDRELLHQERMYKDTAFLSQLIGQCNDTQLQKNESVPEDIPKFFNLKHYADDDGWEAAQAKKYSVPVRTFHVAFMKVLLDWEKHRESHKYNSQDEALQSFLEDISRKLVA